MPSISGGRRPVQPEAMPPWVNTDGQSRLWLAVYDGRIGEVRSMLLAPSGKKTLDNLRSGDVTSLCGEREWPPECGPCSAICWG